MKKIMYILVIVVILLIAWTVVSYFFDRSVASPQYSVLEQKNGYEIRQYEPYITAQVEVTGTYDEALNQGFRILADYIFGNNTKQTGIDMTAPVTESEKVEMTAPVVVSEKLDMTAPVVVSEKLDMTAPVVVSEKLDMTAPVVESGDEQKRIISFVMPFKYTLETLPKPNNPQVKIVPQQARKVAVLRFSWFRSNEKVSNKKQELLSLLERDGVVLKNKPEYAGYNAPFNAPWLNRNEIIVEIE
ncbi:MAG: heme-binding protein [Candidatus Pacebacteria bacterium]|nr:heme-binding protein [Candidatus Paceibacterota bacterium]